MINITQDDKKIIKIKNEQLNKKISFKENFLKEQLDNFQPKGLLEVTSYSSLKPDEARMMQERHNINHALYYLSMMVYSIIELRPSIACTGESKKERIKEHLAYSREFIPENLQKLRLAIGLLIQNLEVDQPTTLRTWTLFIYKNWNLIRVLAKRFGSQERCFPNAHFEKITDIVEGRQWRKVWWWKTKLRRFYRNLNKHYRRFSNWLTVFELGKRG